MHLSSLSTSCALVPYALSAVTGAAFIAPRLSRLVPARWLLGVSVLAEGLALLPPIWLTPQSGYLPVGLIAVLAEGFATGIAAPVALRTALHGVRPADTGAASAGSSAASQLGSSLGVALLSIHSFAVAALCGAVTLMIVASWVSST
jgi:hypothetical protein